MYAKLLFYQLYGVEEYYVYDPDKNELSGFLRGDDILEMIEEINGWVSPRLGIRFQLNQPELNIYYPNGDLFSTYNEEKRKVLEEKRKVLEEKNKVLEEKRKVSEEKRKVLEEKQRADKLAAKLKELGVNIDEL
jgi:hypothetical protein